MRSRAALRGLLAWWLLLACLGAAWASTEAPRAHEITEATTRLNLTLAAEMLVDDTGTLGVEAVAAAARQGRMTPVSVPHLADFGGDTRRTIWLKFDLLADASAPRNWLVEVMRPEIRRVQLFQRGPGGTWTGSAELGDSVSFSARPHPHRHFVFRVHMDTGENTVFLRVLNDAPGDIRATLWQPAALDQQDMRFHAFSGVYYGLVGAMMLYNLLLYAMVRDRGFLLYVACIACSTVAFVASSGLLARYLGDDGAGWGSRILGASWSATMLFRTELARHFLRTRERLPWADLALAACGVAALAMCIGITFLPRGIGGRVLVLIAFGSSLLLDAVSLVAVLRRWPGAVYYCASWMVLSAGILLAGVRFFNGISSEFLPYGPLPVAAAISYVLLAVALANQINEEKQQKQRAQELSLAMLEASRALASENRLDRLLGRVRQIVASLSGATAVRFVLWDAERKDWFLYEPVHGNETRICARKASSRGLLALSVLEHVERTRVPLVVADVLRDERFARDPVFAGADRCAFMALPIVNHGQLRAMLFLEDRSNRARFSGYEIDTLMSIAGPLATSLENVSLYETLERRVAQRTRDLEKTQQELLVTARRAGMAEIASNVLHNVGNVLNTVNVEADLMRRNLHRSSTAGLARAVGLMDAHTADIGAFMQHDPQGRLVPNYLHQLAGELERERQELLASVDQLMARVDHIKNIVATQQAYAGRSTIYGQLQPADLLDDALGITGDLLQRLHVKVERDVASMPAVHLDTTRTLQILVNLINNACQAMEAVVDRPRILRILMDMQGPALRICIQDEGCGIAAENLVRIFSHGFTTREGGHGFGLHSCALAASEMGGSLSAHSDGPGTGATFTLQLPVDPVDIGVSTASASEPAPGVLNVSVVPT